MSEGQGPTKSSDAHVAEVDSYECPVQRYNTLSTKLPADCSRRWAGGGCFISFSREVLSEYSIQRCCALGMIPPPAIPGAGPVSRAAPRKQLFRLPLLRPLIKAKAK